MNRFRLLFTLSFCLLLLGLYGCKGFRLIEVRGLSDDYDKISEETKAKVLPFQSMDSVKHGFIYKITGTQLREAVKNYDKVMVDFFCSSCRYGACIPLSTYENYAKERGYYLFLLGSDYCNMDNALRETRSQPLFVVNTDYYGEKKKSKYLNLFQNEFGKEMDHQVREDNLHQFYFFEHGKFVGTCDSLPNFNYMGFKGLKR